MLWRLRSTLRRSLRIERSIHHKKGFGFLRYGDGQTLFFHITQCEDDAEDLVPGVRVSFIRQMQAFVDANPLIAATLYWDSQVPHCNYEINNSSSSLAALASMGHSPYFQGNLTG